MTSGRVIVLACWIWAPATAGCGDTGGTGSGGTTSGPDTADGATVDADAGADDGEGTGDGGTGSVLDEDPRVTLYESQPMVADVMLTLTRPATVVLTVLDDPGARVGLIGSAEGELEQVYRVRGLAPAAEQSIRVRLTEADDGGEVTNVDFTTLAALPDFRPSFDVTESAGGVASEIRLFDFARFPSSGEQGIFAIEPSGRTRWYMSRATGVPGPAGLLAGVKLLPDGNVAFVQDYAIFVVDELGNEVAAFDHEDLGIAGFHHDVILLDNGNFLVLSYAFEDIYYPNDDETRHVAGDLLAEITPAGDLVWQWNSFDHLDPLRIRDGFFDFPILDPFTGGNALDWTHGNGLVHDPADDTILFSMRHQDWIVKIDHQTGEVLWRLGEGGDFSLDAGKWFFHQHSPEWQPDGSLLLYDNGVGNPGLADDLERSRSVRYELDEVGMTATQAWEHPSEYRSAIAGDADRLPNGNVLELHSTVPVQPGNPLGGYSHVREVDPADGSEVWSLVGPDEYMIYRTIADQRFPGEREPPPE